MEMHSRKMHFRKKWPVTSVGFEPQTSVVRLQRIKHRANKSALTGIWSADLVCLFINDKPLNYTVNGDWVVFNNITNTSICHDSKPTFGTTSTHQLQIKFDPHTKARSFLTPRNKPNQFRSLNWNKIEFDPPQWNQVHIDHPDKNQVNFDAHTKTKRFAVRVQNRFKFRPPPPTQKPSQSIIILKTS